MIGWSIVIGVSFIILCYFIFKGQAEDDRRIAEGIRAIGRKGREESKYVFVDDEMLDKDEDTELNAIMAETDEELEEFLWN